MQVTNTAFTVAEYCGQLQGGSITINRDYQRTDEVWPPAARSYLIDTLLSGFPVPKFLLTQKTDLRTRRTIKQIVDGQQRSKAILDFYEDRLRISGKGSFAGKTFSSLEEGDQQRFLDYSITTDVFVGATDEEIREVFRRMNSYTVPLNPQERRHATHQGAFKWYIIELAKRYASSFKKIGVFSEKQISRMQDAAFLSEIMMAFKNGIETTSQPKLDAFYKQNDTVFAEEDAYEVRLDRAMGKIFEWETIHSSVLMKPFQFFTLLLAVSHRQDPIPKLISLYPTEPHADFDTDVVEANLGKLSAALEQDPPGPFAAYVIASKAATNTKANRDMRFKQYCSALGPDLLP